jgi:broad specificity phosphatase PhoE
MTCLHLVRHGQPEIRQQLPAHEWKLSPNARQQLLALRESGVVPADAAWFSSPEPKAMDTARFLGNGAITSVEGFREQVRSAIRLDNEVELRSAVRRAFENPHLPALPGWEPLDRTRRRVIAAAHHVIETATPMAQVVACGHGTAWTVLVSELTGCAPDLEAWEGMLMPDHFALDLDTHAVVARWGSWA